MSGTRPVANSKPYLPMKKLHRIEAEHIARLAPGQLVGLLRILLYASARPGGATVHVPTQIYVPDGGEDARWEGAVTPTEYIPAALSIYQSKAQELGPADCGEAMLAADGTVKPAVGEALDRNGCYIFFCGRPYVHLAGGITSRIAAAEAALAKAGRPVGAPSPIRFLDANKIAEWANQHAAAVAHVSECCQLPPVGELRTWTDWSRDSIFRAAFHSNQPLNHCIASLRAHLGKPGSIARVTGLSGLGKTRLAFETLRPPADQKDVGQSSLSYSAAYLDMEHHAPDGMLALVSAIEASHMSGLVVVDNCARSQHQKLVDIVQRDGSQLSLLTLDYVPESAGAGCLHVGLEPDMMSDVVPKIVRDLPQAQRLTEAQINHIASFAHGFPQIATLMAEVGDALDFAKLDQKGLAGRILWGRGAADERARQVLCALALFTHVGFDDEKKNQKGFVREKLCGAAPPTEREFDQLLRPFLQRRILQKAGAHRMVAPPPLAVALAADWWESATAEELEQLLPLIDAAGLTESFCQRVRQLHFSPNASALAAHLCGAKGPLSHAEVLSSEPGSQLFRAIVELNPAAAIDCLWRAFGRASPDELRQARPGRRNLVWALEKICWGREQFLGGAEMLLRFAAAENETWANNSTGQFKQLYQLYLAGTQMPALERLPVIEKGLASGDPAMRRVCIEALGVGLNTGHYTRMGGVEVRGSGLPQTDWAPTLNREIAEYWERCFQLLVGVVLEQSAESELAQKELGRRLRGILQPALLDKFEPEFRKVAEATRGFWPEALHSLHSLFEFESNQFSPESLARLRQWEAWITPADLPHRLALLVSEAPFEHEKGPNGDLIDVSAKKAEALAVELAGRPADLADHFDNLQQGDQRQAYTFGRRLGQLVKDAAGFADTALNSLGRLPAGRRNASLLGGFLAGVADPDLGERILKRVAADPQLVDLLVPLTRLSKPDATKMKRIIDLMIQGQISPDQLRHFGYGSVLDDLKPEEVLALLQPLAAAVPASRPSVFDVVCMYVYKSAPRWRACREFQRELLLTAEFSLNLRGTMDLHHWEQTSQQLLKEGRDEPLARELTVQILAAQKSSELRFSGDSVRRTLLGAILENYSDTCWPLVGAELLSPDYYQTGLLLGRHGFDDHDVSILWNVPLKLLLSWVRANPPGLRRVLGMMSLFHADQNGEYHWHPTTLALFGEGLDAECRSAVASNLFSYGSSGSRVPYIEKRLKLLRTLLDHPVASVREMARDLVKAFEGDKAQEQVSDEEEAAGIY
jgi:hypothetical protein